MSDPQPEAGRTRPEAGQLALIAEATKRAGLIWITVPGPGPALLARVALARGRRPDGHGRYGTSGATLRTC